MGEAKRGGHWQEWDGKFFGTNAGNVSLALEGEDDALTGAIRSSDERFGVVVYDATAKFGGGTLALAGKPAGEIPEEVNVGEIDQSTCTLAPTSR